jgi:hypothetical protein
MLMLYTVTRSDTVKLFRHIDPYLRHLSDKLYLREMSSCEWESFLIEEKKSNIESPLLCKLLN